MYHKNKNMFIFYIEYDGYDDVYGHSMEDDYCVSPSGMCFTDLSAILNEI